jgi:hypothetical protein
MRSPVLRWAAFAALGQTRLLHAFGERGSARGYTQKGKLKFLSHLSYSAVANRLAPTRIRAQ